MDNFNLDIKTLFSIGITPTQFIMLVYIFQKDKHNFIELCDIIDEEEIVKRSIHKLYQKHYINIDPSTLSLNFDNFEITAFGIDIIKNQNINTKDLVVKNYKGDFDSFVNAYYELFPTKVRQGNLLVRSDKTSCAKKLKKFIKEYPEFDYDIILKATANYINKCSKDGYRYIKVSHYFIYKDNVSTLASECEETKLAISEGTFQENLNFDDEYGKDLI